MATGTRIDARASVILDRWYSAQFSADVLSAFEITGVQDRAIMERVFLAPLLRLLIAAIQTGEFRYRVVYLDERLRYAPHRADAAVQAQFFECVLPSDESAVISAVGDSTEEACALAALMSEIHKPLRAPTHGNPVRLLAVGDCLLNEIRVFLPARGRELGIELDMRCLYFSALSGQSISTRQLVDFVTRAPPDLNAFSFLTYDGRHPIPLY